MCVTWLIHVCDMTHSCVWHDSFMCVTWPIHLCDMTHSCVWHDSFIRVPWLIHMCDMTYSHVWHDSSICVTWLIHMCDMTHPSVWHVTWLFFMWDMTHKHSYFLVCCTGDDVHFSALHHEGRHKNRSHLCVTWLIHTCDITQFHMGHESQTFVRYSVLHWRRRQTYKSVINQSYLQYIY